MTATTKSYFVCEPPRYRIEVMPPSVPLRGSFGGHSLQDCHEVVVFRDDRDVLRFPVVSQSGAAMAVKALLGHLATIDRDALGVDSKLLAVEVAKVWDALGQVVWTRAR